MTLAVTAACATSMLSPAFADDAISGQSDDAPESTAPGAAAPDASTTSGTATTEAIDEPGVQGVGATAGIAGGGRTTVGGLRITGHYTYQMTSKDWLEGIASFTYGGGGAECFRDRVDVVHCDHGFLDGTALELAVGLRRYFSSQGRYRPFARLAIGLALSRFGDDDLTGFSMPVHLALGLRTRVTSMISIVAASEVMGGVGRFGAAGPEPQAGVAITAGAEFRLE